MAVIGITGGVASGKSSVLKELQKSLGCPAFSSDSYAKELLNSDKLKSRLSRIFGNKIYDRQGYIDRQVIRNIVFEDSGKRLLLENVLHPLIREKWKSESRAYLGTGAPAYLVEIPLLFETDAAEDLDWTVCVACSEAQQIARLKSKRNIEKELARKIIRSQMEREKKLLLADRIVWNDGSIDCLNSQVSLLVKIINNHA